MSAPRAIERTRRHGPAGGVLPGLRWPVTLRQRIFWSVIPMILLLWIIVGAVSIYEPQRILTAEFMKRGEATAGTFAYSSELGVFSEDQQLLEAAIRGVLKNPEVAYAYIYGDEGQILAAANNTAGASHPRAGALSADERAALFERQAPVSAELEMADRSFVEFAVPIITERARSAEEVLIGAPVAGPRLSTVGAVRLGFSLRALERHALRLVQLWLVITVVLLAVSTIVIYGLSRRISRPVNRLTEQAERIAGGVLDETIPVESRDEIGQLAASFNQMARSLKKSIDEREAALHKIQELNRTLEERIAQRTAELQARTAELEERSHDLQHSLTEVRAMGEISRAVSSSLEVREVLATIARYAVTLSDSDGCAIFEFDPADHTIHIAASHNLSRRFLAAAQATPLEAKDAVIAQPFQVPDTAAAPHFRFAEVSFKEGYRSALVVPMGTENATRGAILFRRQAGGFSYRIVDLLTTLANQSKVAIDNARLFQEVRLHEIELEKASRHKSQFLANMSHELRTPLNAILGYTELILDGLYGEMPEKATEVLGRVEYNGRHLLGLINDVLDLSKIEAGQFRLALEDYSMGELVRAVTESVEHLAAEKSLEFAVTIQEDLPRAHGDERRIAQVLLNLAGNAIKFTDTGKVSLDARADGGHFVLSVTDTGPGISENEQRRIFEEFHQVDNSSTREKGGSGLGLSIARRIVEMHGGRLWVESEVGKGATFRVELPIRSEGNADDQANPRG